jgi:hypothetical protein
MAFLINTAAPLENLQKFMLVRFLEFAYRPEKEKEVEVWAKYCVEQLRRSIVAGQRKLVPSQQELEVIRVCYSLKESL